MKRTHLLIVLLLVAILPTNCVSQSGPSPVRVGSKDFTEELLLGEMYAQLLEANGIPVDRHLNLAGTEAAHNALVSGQIDLYPEYSGTAYVFILGIQDTERDPERIAQRITDEYQARWNAIWLDRAPMNDTNAIACTPETTRQYGIKTLSDLAAQAPRVRMAGIPDFPQRPDGLAGLKQVYRGFEFKDLTLYDPPAKYTAITGGKADCVIAFSTEGQIAAYHLVLLQDDRGLWPTYQVAPVIRGEVLQRHPEVRDILQRLAPFITNDSVSALNWEVDGRHQNYSMVAGKFLRDKGLIR
jgi:osmoprotectant transport system substrate-binding protein